MSHDVLLILLDILSLIPIVLILGIPLWIFLLIRWVNKVNASFEDECENMRAKLSKEEYAAWYKKAYEEEMARIEAAKKSGECTIDDRCDWEQQAAYDAQYERDRDWDYECYEVWTNDDY